MKRADAFETVLNELENPGKAADRDFAIHALKIICDEVDRLQDDLNKCEVEFKASLLDNQ